MFTPPTDQTTYLYPPSCLLLLLRCAALLLLLRGVGTERSGRFAVIQGCSAVVSFEVLMATTAAGCDLQLRGVHS